jgi:hypothetical protein
MEKHLVAEKVPIYQGVGFEVGRRFRMTAGAMS